MASDRNVSLGPFDDMSALVQVMAWRRTRDKPSPELAMTKVHGTPWCQIILNVVVYVYEHHSKEYKMRSGKVKIKCSKWHILCRGVV